ncbi:MAG: hypothetical protein IT449_11220 [Phycisphaerales bacterium]|nr:hypothetical protein [Phycisphaerales bacterium]
MNRGNPVRTTERGRSDRRRLARGAMPLWSLGLGLLIGCEAHPPTEVEDVVNYLRNAAAGAEVKRLDPAAQAYVTDVWKAYKAWQKTDAEFDAVCGTESLWAQEADAWRDAEQVAARAKLVEPWRGGAVSQAAAAATTEFENVVVNAPTLPGETPAPLPQRVRAALGMDEPGLAAARQERTETASACGELLDWVQAHVSEFDPKGKGLAFASTETTRKAHELWNVLHARFAAEDAQAGKAADAMLVGGRAERQSLIDRKNELLKAKPKTAKSEVAIRSLDFQIKRFDRLIAAAETTKRKQAHAAAAAR